MGPSVEDRSAWPAPSEDRSRSSVAERAILIIEMHDLTDAFPDAKTLLALQPEEVGDVILELVQADGSGRVMFSLVGIMEPVNNRADPAWSQAVRHQVEQAVAEAMRGWSIPG